MMSKIALHWKILIGMGLGVIFGYYFTLIPDGGKFISDYIKPFGTIFINLLKLIAVPLILASLIKGISDLIDISKLSQMGGRTIIIYLISNPFKIISFHKYVHLCFYLYMRNR